MSAESALYDLLSAAAGVTALVGTRIYPDEVPEEAVMPAIAFQRSGTDFDYTIHSAVPEGAAVTLEVSCVAESRAGAVALANAVVAALGSADFYAVDQQSAADQPNGLWASIVNVTFDE